MKSSGVILFAALVSPPRAPDIEISGFQLVESREDRRSVEVMATKASYFKAEKTTSLESLQAKIWGEPGSTTPYQLRGQHGLLDSGRKILDVREQTELTTPELYTFSAPEFRYDGVERTISSSGFVELKPMTANSGALIFLNGQGLKIDLASGAYALKDKVEVRQVEKGKTPLEIRSRAASLQPQKGVMSFSKNASVRSQDFSLSGQELIVQFESKDNAMIPREMQMSSSSNSRAKISDLELSAKGVTVVFDRDGQVAESRALGEVIAKMTDGLNMTAEQLKMRKEDDEQVVYLQGNVKIEGAMQIATGANAKFYSSSGKVVISEKASVVQGGQRFSGERITFSTRDKIIEVERASGTLPRSDIVR